MGKTLTALAVIKYFELDNESVLVLCPRKLRENWSLYPASNRHMDNPFPVDRFGYTLLSHTDLSRETGRVGDVNLERFNWGNFELIVIDESHNFRNHEGQRYEKLINEAIKAGPRTKVLMLSATPVNTSLIDLRNQIYLMTEGRFDTFRETLGIGSIASLLGSAQKKFKKWEDDQRGNGVRDKAELLESLDPDVFRLLGAVSIARSRRQIEKFYSGELDRIGHFPVHDPPDNRYPLTDLREELSYSQLAEQIRSFGLSVYRPSKYLVDKTRLRELEEQRKLGRRNQADAEGFLIEMILTNFLKRLESSARSLVLTLGRTVDKIDRLIERIDQFQITQQVPAGVSAEVLPDDDEDDEDFLVNRAKNPYHLSELDLDRWRADLSRDRAVLAAARDQVAVVTPPRDGKLREIKQIIRDKAQQPTVNVDGLSNRKVLVFTTFKDTADYLYKNLVDLTEDLGLNMAMVAGTATKTTVGANDYHAILTAFAPRARNRPNLERSEQIDVLIGTDCISEGQNLQDCDTVINYDIHWNPVRLIQRFGRIDRIGSRNPTVRMVNFWPTKDMDVYLRLENRVRARMVLADMTATGDSDPLTEEGIQMELDFRDQQLLKLRDRIVPLEDLEDMPNLTDFTLDYFFAQLLRYLEQNRDELEQTPEGVYAVTEPSGGACPGVVFVLRQHHQTVEQGQRVVSPVHPYYLVYIQADGRIGYGCASTRRLLDAFEALTVGHASPIQALCDQFNTETNNGKNMELYDQLLGSVVDHISRRHRSSQVGGLGLDGGRDFLLSRQSETPQTSQDFDLVTWLVISQPTPPQ